MSETRMEQTNKIDLDALEAALADRKANGHSDTVRDEIIRQLIAELRALRARTTPQVISDRHRDGNYWQIWTGDGWEILRYSGGWGWVDWDDQLRHFASIPTHALPKPEDVEITE